MSYSNIAANSIKSRLLVGLLWSWALATIITLIPSLFRLNSLFSALFSWKTWKSFILAWITTSGWTMILTRSKSCVLDWNRTKFYPNSFGRAVWKAYVRFVKRWSRKVGYPIDPPETVVRNLQHHVKHPGHALAYIFFLFTFGRWLILSHVNPVLIPNVAGLTIFIFTLRNLLFSNQDVLLFPIAPQPPEARFRNAAVGRLMDAGKISLGAILASWTWHTFTSLTWKTFVRSIWTYFTFALFHPITTLSIISSVTSTLFVLSLTDLIVNICMTQPLRASIYTPDALEALLEGAASKDSLIKAHAWWELSRRVKGDVSFRSTIFEDTEGELIPVMGGEPGMITRGPTRWQKLLQTCLKEVILVLDAATAANHNARLSVKPTGPLPQGLQTDQVKPRNAIQKMLQAIKGPTSPIPGPSTNLEPKPVGMSLKTNAPLPPPTVKPKVETKPNDKLVPTPFSPSPSPTSSPCVMALNIIQDLCTASFTEDRFGVVQRELAQILETLTGTLILVDNYIENIQKEFHVLTSDQVVKKFPNDGGAIMVDNALKSTLVTISLVFRDHLPSLAPQLTMPIRQRLQKIVDFE